MSDFLNSLILILTYPAISFCVVEPEAYKWARTHGLEAMPPQLLGKTEERGRWWHFLRFGLTAMLLGIWILARSIPATQITKGWDPRRSLGIVEAVAILVVSRIVFQNLFPRVRDQFANHPLRRGGLMVWISILLVGGVIEEGWRALCLISLQKQALPELVSLFILAVGSTVAQASGIPARIAGIKEEASWQLIMGVVLGKLFLVYGSFLVPATVGFCFNIFNLWQIRRTPIRVASQM